jgi:ribonuclease VapC
VTQFVIDTSALVAVFKVESNAQLLALRIADARRIVLPASCLVEAALLRQIARGFYGWVEEMLADERFEFGEISAPVAGLAASAARIYGKGSGHPAQLNFGDCLSYAVAKHRELPLLYTGGDFARTYIPAALIQD